MASSSGNAAPDETPRATAGGANAEYTVVARRYRPQTFDELIGQAHVARALTGAIAANRVGHAYLFTGARGVGKTSAARILAKALDCELGPTANPCNQCDVCRSISAGSDVDVLEIDGASNRGIDEIRQLRQNVNIRPSRARFKIYIIDEVHMLTKEAFNALLKTLEEPPEHVKFIFCTTEANKIPITILSRCQRFDFAGIGLSSIIERLKQIVAAEGVTAEPEALAILARRAAGSMRDSQSLLEQMLALGGAAITSADVHSMLGTAGESRLATMVAHLAGRQTAAAIAELDAAIAEGVDIGQLLEQLLGYFRDLMLAAVGCPQQALLHTSSSRYDELTAIGHQLGLETVMAIMQILDHTLARLRYSTQSRTLAEMALVRITGLENLHELADLVADLQATPNPSTETTTAARIAKKKAEIQPAATRDDNLPSAVLTADSASRVWQAALTSLEGLLADQAALCESVAAPGGDRLVATFRSKYTSCRVYCERSENLTQLEQALASAAGGRVRLGFATLPDEPSPSAAARRPVPHRQRLAEVAEHPFVRRATELFDARVLRVDESELRDG